MDQLERFKDGDDARVDTRGYLLLFFIVLIGALLRFNGITSQCLWFDEIWHVMLSSGNDSAIFRAPVDTYVAALPDYVALNGPWWRIWSNMDGVLHPPLYHTLLRGWRAMSGDSVMALRGLSAVLSLLAIVAVFDVARLMLGATSAGLWAAALLAVAPGQIEQAQEARNYTLALLLATLAVWATLRSMRDHRSIRWPIVTALVLLALMFTHYFAAGVCVGIGIFSTIALRGRARWIALGAFVAAAVLFTLTWGTTLRSQLTEVAETADPFLADDENGVIGRSIVRFLSLPVSLVLGTPAGGWAALGGTAVIFICFAAWRRNRLIALPLGIVFATALLPTILDVARSTKHLSYLRYTFAASSCMILAIVAAAWTLSPRWRMATLGALVALSAASLPWLTVRPANLEFRPLVEHVAAKAQPGEPFVLLSPNPLGRDGQALYCYLAFYADLFPRPAVLVTKPIDEALSAELSRHPRVWIVSAANRVDARRVWPGAIVRGEARFEPVGSCIEVAPPP